MTCHSPEEEKTILIIGGGRFLIFMGIGMGWKGVAKTETCQSLYIFFNGGPNRGSENQTHFFLVAFHDTDLACAIKNLCPLPAKTNDWQMS